MPGTIEVPEGARENLAETVAALQRPSSYPEAVQRVESIETHMAWVFLTEAHAYKLKKPIRTRLIDYTTTEARRKACETELVLNRRLAAPVYRAVVPVAKTRRGLRVNGEGRAVDWLVKMRRLPRDQMLDARIEREAVDAEAVRHLGTKLSRFYARADPAGWTPNQYRGRVTANIQSKRASLERPRYGLDLTDVRKAVASLLHWINTHGHLLGARAERVVDAHGDLRAEHVCLTHPPMVIDCLEFNRSLRLHDPVSDLSFLSLECRRLGAEWVGDRLIALYRRKTGDHVSPSLIPFYESYHALIRATITIWHLDDPTLDRPDVWRRRAEAYLDLAHLPF